MGETAFYPEEAPVREMTVAGFWIDRHPVTNEQFARFVAATRHVTQAEQPDAAGGLVFQIPARAAGTSLADTSHTWWHRTPGADWRHPRGPETAVQSLMQHPVVQVSLDDALAYCAWVGGDLPTEAEWEYAARGGRPAAIFTWGNEERPNGVFMANTWQGPFPYHNTAEDGFCFTSPVGSFPANGFGLLDMAGNVWEWTADWYTVPHAPTTGHRYSDLPTPHGERKTSTDSQGTQLCLPRRVIKGGSHLCAPSDCFRYRPAARQPQDSETGTSHLGFRTVVRPRE